MKTKEYPKATLLDMLWSDVEGFKIVRNEVVDTHRHGAEHIAVFQHDGDTWGWFYRTHPEEGIQDWDLPDAITVREAVQKTVVTWEVE